MIFFVKMKLLSISGTGMRGRRRIGSLILNLHGRLAFRDFKREPGFFFIWNQAGGKRVVSGGGVEQIVFNNLLKVYLGIASYNFNWINPEDGFFQLEDFDYLQLED